MSNGWWHSDDSDRDSLSSALPFDLAIKKSGRHRTLQLTGQHSFQNIGAKWVSLLPFQLSVLSAMASRMWDSCVGPDFGYPS